MLSDIKILNNLLNEKTLLVTNKFTQVFMTTQTLTPSSQPVVNTTSTFVSLMGSNISATLADGDYIITYNINLDSVAGSTSQAVQFIYDTVVQDEVNREGDRDDDTSPINMVKSYLKTIVEGVHTFDIKFNNVGGGSASATNGLIIIEQI